MNHTTNGMPEDVRLPVTMVKRMEHYVSAHTDRLVGDTAQGDWLDHERRLLATYLLAANNDAWPPDRAIERCQERHVGTYASWPQARRELAALLGWPQVLSDDEREELGHDVRDLLDLGEEAIRARLQKLFIIVELEDDTVYVFYRESDPTA